MNTCCCKDCDKRTAECHSTCKEYAEWARENERLREKRHSEKEQSNPFGNKRPRGFKSKVL